MSCAWFGGLFGFDELIKSQMAEVEHMRHMLKVAALSFFLHGSCFYADALLLLRLPMPFTATAAATAAAESGHVVRYYNMHNRGGPGLHAPLNLAVKVCGRLCAALHCSDCIPLSLR